MKLSEVVPWGRSFSEYRAMFSLSDSDLNRKILGCGDGPACFNAELSKASGNVISVDPVYQFTAAEIRERVDEVYPIIVEQVTKNKSSFIWKNVGSVKELGKIRMDAMTRFLDDYETGKEAGRYINASLPDLPFDNNYFDLALCSHYLFLYSEHVTLEDHILSMKELCRVAREVRVYPLLSLNNRTSAHLEPILAELSATGIQTSLVPVDYEFQKGATKMLVAKSNS